MKKILFIGMILGMFTISFSGCGIPQEDYDAVVKERDEALDVKAEAEVKIATLEEQYNAAVTERDSAIKAKEAAETQVNSLINQKASLENELAETAELIPSPGRIILNRVIVSGDRSNQSEFRINYGSYFDHDDKFLMGDGDKIDSGVVLPPGVYSIDESDVGGWRDPVVKIEYPDDIPCYQGGKATINLAAGKSVLVTYYDSIPVSSGTLSIDQYNETHYYSSYSSPLKNSYQSFTPSVPSLKGVELLLRPGGRFPTSGMTSIVEIREDKPFGQTLGTAIASVSPPYTLGNIVWARFIFETPISLTPGNEYFISWYCPGAMYFSWIGSDNQPEHETNPYKGGAFYSSDGTINEEIDYCFRTLY